MYNQYFVYILSNTNNTTLYIGVTNDIERRVDEHRSGLIPGFTKKYNCHKLVYYEIYSDINQAIDREKQLKKWSRAKKDNLINTINPERNNLTDFSTSLEMTNGLPKPNIYPSPRQNVPLSPRQNVPLSSRPSEARGEIFNKKDK